MAASRMTKMRALGKSFYCTVKSETEIVKETRRQKFGNYLKRMYEDYKEVAVETVKDMQKRPFKAATYISALGVIGVLAKTNPDEQSFRALLLENTNDLLVLGDSIRNPAADNHMQMILQAYNEGLIRRLNIGVCSFMWCANYDRAVDLYEARCSHIKPKWKTYHERIVDVGVYGRWVKLSEKMEDYDINPAEWENEEKKMDT